MKLDDEIEHIHFSPWEYFVHYLLVHPQSVYRFDQDSAPLH